MGQPILLHWYSVSKIIIRIRLSMLLINVRNFILHRYSVLRKRQESFRQRLN